MILASIFIRFDTLAILFLSSLASRSMKFRLAHCNRVIGVVIQGIGEEEKEEKECLVSQNSQQTRFSNGEMIYKRSIFLFKNWGRCFRIF